VLGTEGLLQAAPEQSGAGHGTYELDELQRIFLFARADTIYGGSDEVQKNILAERVLGLPREPKGA
jgi:alkylation response protein AidB-like acyl-CoA dehydrogenase